MAINPIVSQAMESPDTPGRFTRILELGPTGWNDTTWQELELVAHHHRFLNDPDSYLRHLLTDE